MGGAGGRGLSESRQHGSLGGKSRRVTVEKVKRSRGPVFKKFTSVHKDKAPKFTQRQPTSRRCFFFLPKTFYACTSKCLYLFLCPCIFLLTLLPKWWHTELLGTLLFLTLQYTLEIILYRSIKSFLFKKWLFSNP